jgi:hypothetical protein
MISSVVNKKLEKQKNFNLLVTTKKSKSAVSNIGFYNINENSNKLDMEAIRLRNEQLLKEKIKEGNKRYIDIVNKHNTDPDYGFYNGVRLKPFEIYNNNIKF